jgi:hypothetical protein
MRSLAQLNDESDDRFVQAEADIDAGEPWLFREENAPNPLVIEAVSWSTGFTKLGEAEFLNGIDRHGKKWSILVGTVVLTKRLIEGVVEQWDDEQQDFVVVETLGRVQPGEVVAIKYLGDVDGGKYPYPNFRVSRKPPVKQGEPSKAGSEPEGEDDIPF